MADDREAWSTRSPCGANVSIFDVLIVGTVIGLVVVPPLALGAVATWAQGTVLCGAFALLALWFLGQAWRGEVRVARLSVWVWMLLFFALAFLQLIPLPVGVVRAISPATLEAWEGLLPAGGTSHVTVSLFPYGTATTILWMAAPAIVFFVVVNSVRRPWQVASVIGALVVLAVFQVFYGSWEEFSGHRHVFWVTRHDHLAAVTGTYLNKNHFAGLLEMVLPATLGLLAAVAPRGDAGVATRVRVAAMASSPSVHLPVILAWAAGIIAIGVCLSMSRSAMMGIVMSVAALGMCIGLAAGFRRYTLILLLFVIVVLLLAVAIGSDILVKRVEMSMAERSTSWGDRMDLARSGLRMLATYPMTGTGLGSFRYAFERFQSARFGDRVADYLHNDWLQVTCEMGLPGLVIVLGGVASAMVGTIRLAFRRSDTFCRWVCLGTMTGVGAMLFHSFFDYNLYKIPANRLVFAALAGVGVAAARMPSRRAGSVGRGSWIAVRLGGVPVRLLLAVVVISGLIAACRLPVRLARADVAFHRFLAVSGLPGADPYFMLPLPRERGCSAPSGHLDLARRLNPWNPVYDHIAAAWALRRSDDGLREMSLAALSRLFPEGAGTIEPSAMRDLEDAMRSTLRFRTASECVADLRQAYLWARRSVERLPVAAGHHALAAEILARLDEAGAGESASAAGERASLWYARRARWLAPSNPDVLFRCGMVLLSAGPVESPVKQERHELSESVDMFRRALEAEPTCAERVFPVARRFLSGTEGLKRVTPPTLAAGERLAAELEKEGAWEDLLGCLDGMEAMLVSGDRLSGSTRSDGVTVDEMRLAIARRRCAALGLLERWDERRTAVARYRECLRRVSARRLAAAMDSPQPGGSRYTMDGILAILDQDWANPEVLLAASETALRHGASDGLPEGNGPLDFLFRLVVQNERLDPETVSRLDGVIRRVQPATPADQVVAAFVRAASALRSGALEEAVHRLEALTARSGDAVCTWRQRHMPWYFLGLALEQLGQPERAAAAYAHAIEIVPSHRPSLVRLAGLSPEGRSLLERVTPRVRCEVEFGGKVLFLGYEVVPDRESVGKDAPRGEGSWLISYYWQFEDGMHRAYQPSVKFCDRAGRILLTDDHVLCGPDGAPYPVDFPRCGEVVIERRRISGLPAGTRYLRIGIYAPDPPAPLPNNLYFDSGPALFVTVLRTQQVDVVLARGGARETMSPR